MKQLFNIIKNSPLFIDIEIQDYTDLLSCLDAKTTFYKKDDIILMAGDKVNNIGLILSGRVKITRIDKSGNVSILTELTSPGTFAEVFSCAGITSCPVNVEAAQDTEILLLNYKKIITTCASQCKFHNKLIENMLKLIAHKNMILNEKLEILTKRTTREKLMCYFHLKSKGKSHFTIPYNRTELANYLSVDRSAMSSELSKMKKDGLIDFHKNEFTIL